MNIRVPFLNRVSVWCLKSSSFYFWGSNNKGLTRKSKNSIKENSGITDSKKYSNIKSTAENDFFQRNLCAFPLNIVQISFVALHQN